MPNQQKNQNKKHKVFFLSFGIGVLIIILAIYFYSFTFGFSISKDQAIWGQFGDFMNVFVAIANLFVVSFLTYYLNKIEEKREEENKILEKSKVRPILIFRDIGMKWECVNVGEGTAMNIMIAYKTNTDSWENPVKIYSLIPKEKFEIDWKKYNVSKWVATYYDIHNTVFTSICEKDDTIYEIDKNELYEFENNYKRLEDVKNLSFDS